MNDDGILVPTASSGFGVELECCIDSDTLYDWHRKKDSRLKFFSRFKENDFCKIKDDSSCGGEINLGIFDFTPKNIHKFSKTVESFCSDLKLIGLSLEDEIRKDFDLKKDEPIDEYMVDEFISTGQGLDQNGHLEVFSYNCGMHVHLSRSLFPNDSSIERFFSIFGKYEDDIFRYCVDSTRSGNEYAVTLTELGKHEYYKMWEIEDLEHYHCVNLSQNHDTIEIRHSGMYSNTKSVKNWLLVIYELYKHSLTVKAFEKIQKHPTLKSLLEAKKNLSSWLSSKDISKFSYIL
jgi:hypothetical protein